MCASPIGPHVKSRPIFYSQHVIFVAKRETRNRKDITIESVDINRLLYYTCFAVSSRLDDDQAE